MKDGRKVLMAWNVDWSVPGDELVIQRDGVTSRMAAGELTSQVTSRATYVLAFSGS